MTAHTLVQEFGDDLTVETRGAVKRFKNTDALKGLDLSIPEGAVYVLVGPNGAGKTTALRLLLDELRPNEGSVRVFGLDPASAGAQVRASIGYVPETGQPPYGWMAVSDLLAHHASYYAAWDAPYASKLSKALDIRSDAPFGKLSKGERRRVQLVMAMSHRPRLLLLDEPTDGLDPVVRDRFFELLADHLATCPTTALISSHLVYESELFADHLGVLRNGRLSAQLARTSLDEQLRGYVTGLPQNGFSVSDVGHPVLALSETRGEVNWIIWGNEEDICSSLTKVGAAPRSVRRLNLVETARVLMSHEEVS